MFKTVIVVMWSFLPLSTKSQVDSCLLIYSDTANYSELRRLSCYYISVGQFWLHYFFYCSHTVLLLCQIEFLLCGSLKVHLILKTQHLTLEKSIIAVLYITIIYCNICITLPEFLTLNIFPISHQVGEKI